MKAGAPPQAPQDLYAEAVYVPPMQELRRWGRLREQLKQPDNGPVGLPFAEQDNFVPA